MEEKSYCEQLAVDHIYLPEYMYICMYVCNLGSLHIFSDNVNITDGDNCVEHNERTDDWILYIQRFEHFLLANNVKEDTQKQHLLLAMIEGHTFKLSASLVALQKPGEVDYAEILKSIGTVFQT